MPNKKMSLRKRIKRPRLLPKAPTGIQGLDEITVGGLPKGRTTLVCGSAGCGKTMFAMEFLVRGAQQYGEPGVFVSFEESAEDLAQNVASMGFDLKALAACIRGSRQTLAREDVAAIRAPVLVAVGTEDVVAGSAHELVALLPCGRAFDIPRRDHMLAVGDKAFKAAVLRFLAEQP